MLRNLLANAINYATQEIILKVTYDFDYQRLYVTVFDDGCGIYEEDTDKLFTRFGMLNSKSRLFSANKNGTKHGLGIGLSVCKAIIEKLNG